MSKNGINGETDPELRKSRCPRRAQSTTSTATSTSRRGRGSRGHRGEGASSLSVTTHPSPPCDNPRGFVLKVAGKATPAEEQEQVELH